MKRMNLLEHLSPKLSHGKFYFIFTCGIFSKDFLLPIKYKNKYIVGKIVSQAQLKTKINVFIGISREQNMKVMKSPKN